MLSLFYVVYNITIPRLSYSDRPLIFYKKFKILQRRSAAGEISIWRSRVGFFQNIEPLFYVQQLMLLLRRIDKSYWVTYYILTMSYKEVCHADYSSFK